MRPTDRRASCPPTTAAAAASAVALAGDALVHVATAGGRCVIRPIRQAPMSAQEIELARRLRDWQAPSQASRPPRGRGRVTAASGAC